MKVCTLYLTAKKITQKISPPQCTINCTVVGGCDNLFFIFLLPKVAFLYVLDVTIWWRVSSLFLFLDGLCPKKIHSPLWNSLSKKWGCASKQGILKCTFCHDFNNRLWKFWLQMDISKYLKVYQIHLQRIFSLVFSKNKLYIIILDVACSNIL